ncbi:MULTISPECIES: hypothetical protein [Commensalibacter]|uniref:Uncharacterized protein n=2 Tax=Commensalibacter TaxID=1079922 RepID=W7E7C8_9PROT|nr:MULTISPECIES: hypothetical protein [Commensalibacter]EUK19071.1 hypothetical protein COMX_04955 [Commensalibacter papalotli (ex Servin-Garciduenas et al. 2014)]CAI3923062.1 unnamed protein product [Commensalibacter papalotli (ex Botero et al. 2024)]CAI3928956.1 unnamed protein product [Commensalibacter papalotli (ex Botero et al. 2024)]
MIKRVLTVAIAVGACIWFVTYIKSYNSNTNFNVQQRFDDIMDSAQDQAQSILKEADEKKKKAFQILKERKDTLIQQQQKELFDQR